MADPEVLHTNPNVPQDEDGTGSEALFAGLNDAHELLVQALSLVGNSETTDGPAEVIDPIPPLYIPPGTRTLIIDGTGYASASAFAAVQAQVANNAAAIIANAAAIAANTAAIAALQQQVAANVQAIIVLQQTLKPGSYFGSLGSNFAGAGAMAVRLALPQLVTAVPGWLGGGLLTATIVNPKPLAPQALVGAGLFAINVSLQSANRYPITSIISSSASALSAQFVQVRAAVAALAGSGLVGVDASKLTAPLQLNLAGAGNLQPPSPIQRMALAQTFAGAGALRVNLTGTFNLQAGLVGAGTLVADLRSGSLGVISFQGNSVMTAPAIQRMAVTAPLFGSGVLAAAPWQLMALSGALAGSGALSPTATSLSLTGGAASWLGAGAISAPSLTGLLATQANLAGAGAVPWAVNDPTDMLFAAGSSFAGAGALSAIIGGGPLGAAFAGNGVMGAAPRLLGQLGSVGLAGAGALSVNAVIPTFQTVWYRFEVTQ